MTKIADLLTLDHKCDDPATCSRRGPIDCAMRGNLGLIYGPHNFPVAVMRRHQRALDAAVDAAEFERIYEQIATDAHFRAIEKQAQADRVAQLKADPKGYQAEFRAAQNALRELNKGARVRAMAALRLRDKEARQRAVGALRCVS